MRVVLARVRYSVILTSVGPAEGVPPLPSMLTPPVYPASIRSVAPENRLSSRVHDVAGPARSNSLLTSHASSCPTPMLDSSSDLGSDPDMLPGFDEVSRHTHRPEVYAFATEIMLGTEEMLYSGP